MNLSVVIPVYNEEESLEPLLAELRTALDPTGRSYEIIIVDDGSTDGTYPTLLRLFGENHLKAVRLKRDSAQTAAVGRRLRVRPGDIIIAMAATGKLSQGSSRDAAPRLEDGFDS